MRRLMALLCLLLLPLAVLCEDEAAEPEVPLMLRTAATEAEVMQFLQLPPNHATSNVQRGYIRYIAQNQERDETFRKKYWLGGEEGSVLDLTLKERRGVKFDFHAGVMCSRAAYSMAMSYLGLDVTPGDMSAMMNSRNLTEPYDMISWKIGVEHALLVVAALPETSRFLVVDSSAIFSKGEPHRIYMISLNKTRQKVVNSTFRHELVDSRVLQLYQWRLLEPDAAE